MTPSLANEINYTLYDRFIISFGTILRQSNSDFVTGSLDLSELLVKKKKTEDRRWKKLNWAFLSRLFLRARF